MLTFADEPSILAFLDHSLKRFQEHPDAKQPPVTERYMRFPSMRLEDAKSEASPDPLPDHHAAGERCPAWLRLPPGTIVAHVLGRALDADGKLAADTVSQDRYAQDRFYITPDVQEALATALAGAGTGRVRLPGEFSRLCVMHAYLGQTDVQPLSNPLGGASDLQQCELWAQPVVSGTTTLLMHVEGKSEVVSELARRSDGTGYRHEIALAWEGFLEMNGRHLTRVLLSGRGTEKLRWGSEGLKRAAERESEVAYLPAGHPIDLACAVRYGIIGEVVPAAAGAADIPARSK